MKVQRVCLPDTNGKGWLVLDDDFMPIQPILSYLKFLQDLDRSPNTIRTAAHHLKLFWEYLRDEHLDWTEIDIARLAGFITWLRRRHAELCGEVGKKKRGKESRPEPFLRGGEEGKRQRWSCTNA